MQTAAPQGRNPGSREIRPKKMRKSRKNGGFWRIENRAFFFLPHPRKIHSPRVKKYKTGAPGESGGAKGCEQVLPVSWTEIDLKLAAIRRGDSLAREDLIAEHRPFVSGVARKVCGRALEWDRDDELSIGLAAFNEAIDRFDGSRSVPFQAFARLIIKSRITDYHRRQSRHFTHSAGSLDGGDPGSLSSYEASQAWERYLDQEAAREREEEIVEYRKVIGELGISFEDLVKCSPRHRDTRTNLLTVSRKLAGDRELFSQLMTTGKLPVMALCQRFGVSAKTLERGRKYIIATSVIWHFCEDFLYLCSFVKPPGKENVTG